MSQKVVNMPVLERFLWSSSCSKATYTEEKDSKVPAKQVYIVKMTLCTNCEGDSESKTKLYLRHWQCRLFRSCFVTQLCLGPVSSWLGQTSLSHTSYELLICRLWLLCSAQFCDNELGPKENEKLQIIFHKMHVTVNYIHKTRKHMNSFWYDEK